jgi:hypothetical protein
MTFSISRVPRIAARFKNNLCRRRRPEADDGQIARRADICTRERTNTLDKFRSASERVRRDCISAKEMNKLTDRWADRWENGEGGRDAGETRVTCKRAGRIDDGNSTMDN